jgi:hypothetical protein
MPNPQLDNDLATLDTSRPVLVAGLKDLKLEAIELADNNDKDGKLLKYRVSTTAPDMRTNGEAIPSASLFGQISIKATPKFSAKEVERHVGEFCQCFRLAPGLVAPADVWTNELATKLQPLVGQIGRCRVDVRKERTDSKTGRTYPESNEVVAFLKV